MVKFALSQICDDLIISPPGPNVTRKIMIDAILAHQRQQATAANISLEPARSYARKTDILFINSSKRQGSLARSQSNPQLTNFSKKVWHRGRPLPFLLEFSADPPFQYTVE